MNIAVRASLLSIVLASSLPLTASAQQKVVVKGEMEPKSLLSRVSATGVLHKSDKQIQSCDKLNGCSERTSTLRVSYIILEHGSSTDLSPNHTLFLTMFNDINEHATVHSSHEVDYFFKFRSAKRLRAGVYQFEYKSFFNNDAIDKTCAGIPIIQATVDARELSAAVRKGKKAEEDGGDDTYIDPIYVTKKVIGCD